VIAADQLDILFIGTLSPHPGGSSIVSEYLLRGLVGLGHRVRALAPITDWAREQRDGLIFQHQEIAVTWYRVPHFSSSKSSGSTDVEYLAAEREAVGAMFPRLLAERKPDVVIVGRESIAWNEALTGKDETFRLVLLVHGGSTFNALDREMPEIARLLERFCSMDLVITVARHLMARLQQLGLSRLCTIPNPVDICRFRPGSKDRALMQELGIEANQLVVLHASKLSDVKRPFDLIESAKNALRQNPRLIYLIIGNGPCRDSMEEACQRAGIRHAFRFTGWIDHRLMPNFLNLADIVILPSDSEGQSLVCLEAQACARCVLSSDIPGARELITENHTGLLFGKGNLRQMTEKTLWAAANSNAREAIGRNARYEVQSHDVEKIVALYATTLRRVVAARP
jgi:glycosyltransferase involved in cell wall biosynthesis